MIWTSQLFWGSVHPTPEGFKKKPGGFALKTYQMFFVYNTPEKFENEQLPEILNLCLRTTQSGRSHNYRDNTIFEKLRFQNPFCPHEHENTAFWKPFSKSLLKCSFNFQDSVVSSRLIFSLCLIHIRDSIFCHKYSIFLELKYSALLIYEWKVIVDILCCSITSKKCCTEN